MPRPVLIAAAVLCVTGPALAQGPATTRVADRPVGRWRAVRIGANRVPDDRSVVWTIEPGRLTVTGRNGQRAGQNRITIDRASDPPRITLHVDGEKTPRVGWFRVSGDELHLLFSINTGRPPASWDDGPLLVFRPARVAD